VAVHYTVVRVLDTFMNVYVTFLSVWTFIMVSGLQTNSSGSNL
jgi:hypothetical protein